MFKERSRGATFAHIRNIGRLLAVVVAIAAAAAIGAGTFFAGAGSALAPEPAKLSASMGGTTGATACRGLRQHPSTTPTEVAYYNSSWVVGSTGPAAGTPCSASALPAGETTSHVIQVLTSASTTIRRCA